MSDTQPQPSDVTREIEAKNTSEHQLFRTGHVLNEASGVLWGWISQGSFSDQQMVGACTITGIAPTGEGFMQRRRLAAEMMYAFAVEAWLKGLIAIALPSAEGARWGQLVALVEDSIDTNAPGEDEVLEAFQSKPVRALEAEQEEQRLAEVSQRMAVLKPHGRHDLTSLARAAGITLDTELETYVDALSITVQLGRYPAHLHRFDGHLEPLTGNQDLRSKLNSSICQRYMELLAARSELP